MTTNWTAMDVNTFSAQDKWAYYLVAGFMTPECHSFVVCQNPEEKKKLITYGVDNIKSFLLQASTGSHAALSDSKSAQEIRCVVDYCGLLLCHCHETVPFQDLTIKEFIELTFKCIALYNSEAINVCMKQLLAFLTKFYDDKVRKKFINCAIEASIEIGECMQGGKHVVASRNSFRILPREVIAKISAGTGISTSYVLSSLITCFISENTRTIWDPSCPGVIEESWTIRQQSQLFPLATYLINNSAIMALIEDAVVLLRQLIEAGPLPIVALHAAESLVEAFGKRHCFALNSDEIRKKAADCFEAINLTLLSSTGPPISDKTDFEKLPAILSEIFLQMTSSALSMQFHPAELMLESLLYQLTLIPKDSLNDAFFVRSFTDERVKFLSTTIQNLVQSRLARYTVAREGLALVQRVSALFDIQIFLMQNFVADGEQQLDSWVQEVVTAGTSSTASWAQAVCGCSQDETEFFCKTAMLIAFHKCKNVVKKRDFVAKFMPRQNELFKWITKEDRSLTAEKHRDLVSWYFYVAAVCVLEHVQEPRGWITILSLPIAVGVDAMSPLQWTDARFWLPADDNCGMVSFKKMLKHSTYLQPIVDNYMTTITFQSFCYVNSTTDHHWVFDVLRFAIRSAEKTKIPTQLQTLAQCLPFFASRHPSYCLQLARELWKQSHHLINSIIISFIADLVCISSGKAGNGAVDCQLCCNSRAPLPVLVSSKDQKEYVNELRALLFPVVVHSNHFPPDVMQAVIRLLRSLLFHTDRMSLRRLWNVSLSLMYDNRAEIREAYIKFFTILVKDEHLEKCLAGPLRVFFHGCFSKADRNKSPICVVYSAPLMRVFIRNTKNYNNTLRFLLHKCIRPTQFSLQQFHVLWSETRSAIYELCQKDSYLMMLGLGPSELRRRFFYRRCREVVKCVVESMRLGAFDSSQSEAFDDVEMKGVLSLCMQRMCLIFDFNSVAKLAMKIKNVIVAHVLSLYAGSVRFATCVLDFLVQRYFSVCKINPNINQQLQRQELIREAFPTLIEIWTHSLNWDHVATFCHEYCELTVEEIVSRERKRCFASHVSFNAKMLMDEENSVTKVLKKVYKKIHYGKFNLTELFKFNKEGSEFLMHFYKIGHKDEMKELLTNAAKCLAIILQEVEPKFIEDNAWFILRALRVLWTAPGGAMEAYSTFVEHVNYPVLRAFYTRLLVDLERSEPSDAGDVYLKLASRFEKSRVPPGEKEDLLPRISFPISSVTLDQMMLTKYHIREARDAHAQARISSDYFNNFHRYSVNGAIRRIYVSHEILLFSAHHSLLTSLARNICSLMEYTTDDAHGNLTAKLLGRLGCYDSDEIDYGYVRWSREFHAFYGNPSSTNEGFLLDFLNVTEQLPSDPDSFEFCEKAMVDCASLLGAQAAQQKDDEMRIIVDSVKSYYGKSDFKGFAGPRLVKLQRLFAKSARDFFSFVEQIALFVIRDTDKELHAVRFMAHCKNVVFCTKLLPRLVLHFLYTRPESEFKELVQELMAVVQLSMNFNAKNWVFKYGAQAVFFVVDYLEFVLSRNSPEQDEKKHEKVRAFLKALFESVDEREGLPTMIACAEHACYEHRCLRWIESYATAIPRATYYHSLQKFYARVHDIFGVHGALKQLMEVEPEHIRGLILASEVHGESNAASFLYKRDPTILNTTGPQLLDDLENSFRDLVLECDDDVSRFNSLADQFESLRSLREWDKVCPSQDTEEESYTISYYSSVMAKRNWRSLSFVSRIMYYAKNRDADNVKAVITEARESVLMRLRSISLGGGCSYETLHPLVIELNVLDDAEDLIDVTDEELNDPRHVTWQKLHTRMRAAEQQGRMGIVQALVRVRRNLLQRRLDYLPPSLNGHVNNQVVECYLSSARIYRLTMCYEKAMKCLMSAKDISPCDTRVVLEEAKVRLDTNCRIDATKMLDELVNQHFPTINALYETVKGRQKDAKYEDAVKTLNELPSDDKEMFVKINILRVGQTVMANATLKFPDAALDLANLFTSFVTTGVMHQAAWYYDYLQQKTKNQESKLLQAYRSVAKYERSRVLAGQAIERMVGLWLSVTRNMKLHMDEEKREKQKLILQGQMHELDKIVEAAQCELGWRAMYAAFPMLVLRLDHPDENTFNVIKHIMVQLIVRYPHSCLWQCAYLLRCDDNGKSERIKEVLSAVKKKHATYATLIEQYDFAAYVFLKMSEDKIKREDSLSQQFPQLKMLIRDNQYDTTNIEFGRRKEANKLSVKNGIIMPIKHMLDERVYNNEESFEVMAGDDDYARASRVPDTMRIKDFEEKFDMLSSLTKPKVVAMRLADGRVLKLMCKGSDNLCKDHHFMKLIDLANTLLEKDELAGYNRLKARSYSVIPLAACGGVIEYMPGLNHLSGTLEPLMSVNSELSAWSKRWGTLETAQKRKSFYDEICAKVPLVMGRWFRDTFNECGKWYCARKMFAKTSAVMSMIGFVFGLGDRHARNLMVDPKSGAIVHVDFDSIFNVADFMQFAELVPFRLTRNMRDGMGAVAYKGDFYMLSGVTMRVLRDNYFQIEKAISELPDLVSSTIERAQRVKSFKGKGEYDMSDAKRLVSCRLQGFISTAVVHKAPNVGGMKTEEQVNSLIELATNDDKLAEMYFGWLAVF